MGRENEIEAYRNMIHKNPNGVVSIVSDSYDIYKACQMFGTTLKQDIIDNNVSLVVRPDSGIPNIVVSNCLEILDRYFGHSVNEKGYKVLNNVKVLQGDGINDKMIDLILDTANSFFNEQNQLITTPLLEGRTVMNLFFENSTRTRTTFEAAAKRLSANVLNIDIARSSTSKGETLRDTLWNLEAKACANSLGFVFQFLANCIAIFVAISPCSATFGRSK